MRLASEAAVRYRPLGEVSQGDSGPIAEKAPGSPCDARHGAVAMSSCLEAQRRTRGLSCAFGGIGSCGATPQGAQAPGFWVAALPPIREAIFFQNELLSTCRNGVTLAGSRCKRPKELDLGRFQRYTGPVTRGAGRNA